MKKKKNLPVIYVINTSSDEAHILGNGFFKEQGAILVGPRNYERYIVENKKLLMIDKISEDAIYNTRLVPLDNYIDNDKVILLDDLKIEIKKIKSDNEQEGEQCQQRTELIVV
jgi:hypothetical protein